MKFTAFLPSLLTANSVAITTALSATAATLVPGLTDICQLKNTFPTTDGNLSGDSFIDVFYFRVASLSEGTVLLEFAVAPMTDTNYFNFDIERAAVDLDIDVFSSKA